MISLQEFAEYDGLGLAQLVRDGEVTPRELKDAALEGIQKTNPQLNAVISVLDDEAEKEIRSGLPEGPLTGNLSAFGPEQ